MIQKMDQIIQVSRTQNIEKEEIRLQKIHSPTKWAILFHMSNIPQKSTSYGQKFSKPSDLSMPNI